MALRSGSRGQGHRSLRMSDSNATRSSVQTVERTWTGYRRNVASSDAAADSASLPGSCPRRIQPISSLRSLQRDPGIARLASSPATIRRHSVLQRTAARPGVAALWLSRSPSPGKPSERGSRCRSRPRNDDPLDVIARRRFGRSSPVKAPFPMSCWNLSVPS